jgi:hypothetical protein
LRQRDVEQATHALCLRMSTTPPFSLSPPRKIRL